MTSPVGTIDQVAAVGYDNNDLGTAVVTAVTATSPLSSTGGETPNITISANAVTGWDDLLGPAASGLKDAGVVTEAFADTNFTAIFLEYDRSDAIYWTLQTTHRWDRTTSLYFHIHWVPMADPVTTEVVRFSGEYAWAHIGGAIPLATGWTPIPAQSFSVAPGDVLKHKLASIATIPPPSPAFESDILLIRIVRPGATDAADTYHTSKSPGSQKANVCILSGDAHYQVQKAGTATEIPQP